MKMRIQRNVGLLVLLTGCVMFAGCVVRPVATPVVHHQPVVKKHVVYNVKPAKRTCWRHRGHWDCK